MEYNDLRAQFNELHNLAQGFLASVQTELEIMKDLYDNTATANQNLRNELDALKITNRNISCELAKTQEARKLLEDERDTLRVKNQQLNSAVTELSASVTTEQRARKNLETEKTRLSDEIQRLNGQLQQARAERDSWQLKWAQIRKFIAG